MKIPKLLVLPALFWVSSAATLDQLFVVKTTGKGACSDNQRTIISSWLVDTETLVDATLAAIPNYNTDASIRRNLAAWFSIRTTRQNTMNQSDKKKADTVYGTLQEVKRFLLQQNPDFVNEGDGTGRPRLFCDSSWQEETEKLFNDDGTAVMIPGSNPSIQASLRTFPPTTGNSVTDSMLRGMQLGTSPNWSKYAYYSSDLHDYVLEDAENRYLEEPHEWCNSIEGDTRFAITEARQKRDVITLCPTAFGATAEPFETIALAGASPLVGQLGTGLGLTSPRGLTLFHELIHLVKSPDQTPDVATKPEQCLMTTLAGKDAVKNPDSYVFMAWSYYLTANGNPSYHWESGLSSIT